jgi:hypothetical protein
VIVSVLAYNDFIGTPHLIIDIVACDDSSS